MLTTVQDLQLHAYGALVGAVTFLAWLTRDTVLHRVSLLSLGGWVTANLCVVFLGFSGEPMVMPVVDAAIAVVIGMIGRKNRSVLCFILVLFYLMQETVALVAFLTHNQGARWYYSLQNSVFILRMLALGGWSIGWLLASRSHVEHRGVHHRVLGG